MKKYLFAAILVFCSSGASIRVHADEPVPQVKPEVSAESTKDISAVEANDYLSSDSRARDNAVVLDIRTGKEFGDGHIKGAMNLNFLGDDFKEKLAKLDRDRVYVMHCQSGGRSGRAKAVFKELGFKKILHIQDGYRAWASAGFAVEKGAAAKE